MAQPNDEMDILDGQDEPSKAPAPAPQKTSADDSNFVEIQPGVKVEVKSAGMSVPKGGSMCGNCKFLGDDQKTCTEPNFIQWEGPDKPAGSNMIPGEIDAYCSDWYKAAMSEEGETEGRTPARPMRGGVGAPSSSPDATGYSEEEQG